MTDAPEISGPDVIYRPPLWAPGAAYSAEDDRRLIMSAFSPGVIDLTDLKVVPRAEGANMSVDVLPGQVIIAGADYPDQGRYLCVLAQRINVPLEDRPPAGSHRRDYINAILHEEQGQEPWWEVRALPGVEGPTSAEPPHAVAGTNYPSASMIANVVPVGANTPGITADLIYDFRHRARPASTGGSILKRAAIANGTLATAPVAWGGTIWIGVPPYEEPVDTEMRVEGGMSSNANSRSVMSANVQIALDAAGNYTYSSPAFSAVSEFTGDANPFSKSLILENVTLHYPDQIRGRVIGYTHGGYAAALITNAQLICRITPSGSALSW